MLYMTKNPAEERFLKNAACKVMQFLFLCPKPVKGSTDIPHGAESS
jgi:hypothetical protein